MFKIGDKIRFKHKNREATGVVEGMSSKTGTMKVRLANSFDTNGYFVEAGDAYRLDELPNKTEKLTQFASQNMGEAHSVLSQILGKLLPEFKIERGQDYLKVDAFTLMPCITERKSIGVIREVIGWSVTAESVIRGGYHEPDDVDVVDICEELNLNKAIDCLAIELFKVKLQDFHESKLTPSDFGWN